VIEEEKSPERNTGKGSGTMLSLPHQQAQTLIIGIRNGSDTILTLAYLRLQIQSNCRDTIYTAIFRPYFRAV
jgi:hypothetical protein